MKKIFSMLMAFAAATMTFTSCSESNDAFFTATENDYPRILNTDIPEASGGGRATLPSITRNNNFLFTVIVTPAQYTKVTWQIDGVEVPAEYTKDNGKTIDYSMIAGTYDVDIIATTTQGKTTKRMCSLEVLPVDGDPAIVNDPQNIWCQIGTQKTLNVSNFDDIATMTIGGQAVDFANNGSSITFTVPTLEVGEHKVIVATTEGMKYGCGNVHIDSEKYVAPGVEENTLWEGSLDINWGDANISIKAADLANVKVGDKIKLYYEVPEAEYHAMRITTGWWGDNAEDNLVPQFDITGDTPNPYEFEYTEACKALVDERGDMLIVGFGYKVTKVTYETGGAPVEKAVWEGDKAINWGDSNISIPASEFADVKVGSQISIYYTVPEAEYHAMRITTGWWGDNAEDNLVPQFDITDETPNPYVFEYTEACKALVDERGDMLIVGFGYNVTKVTVK